MTEPAPTPPRRDDLSPLTPKPGSLAVALLLVGLMFYNLWLDAGSDDYDGKYVTFAVVGLIAGILGVDLSRFWRGKDSQ